VVFYAIIFSALLLFVVASQYVFVFYFHRVLRSGFAFCDTAPEYTPKVALLITLRGQDPGLAENLENLFLQDYPNYKLLIVVDSEEDSALHIIREVLAKHPGENAEVLVTPEHPTTCSLVCNSQAYAISQLDDSYEIVAIVDSDLDIPKTWLREMVQPFQDPQVGGATGIRWFVPERTNWGTLVRYFWNLAAIVQMSIYKMPWGGSLAIRRSVIEEGDFLNTLRNSFCEDQPTATVVRKLNKKMAYVGSLLLPSRESCSLHFFFRFVRRQMFCAKVYSRSWLCVLAQCMSIFLIPLAVLMFALLAGLQKDWLACWVIVSGFALYTVGYFGAGPYLVAGTRKIVSKNRPNFPFPEHSIAQRLKMLVAVPVTQLIYTVAVASLYFCKKVIWRGVSYRFPGKGKVEMLNYSPYTRIPDEATDGENASL